MEVATVGILKEIRRVSDKIVYAKQKGFPYWPAKVVNNKENSDGQVKSCLISRDKF